MAVRPLTTRPPRPGRVEASQAIWKDDVDGPAPAGQPPAGAARPRLAGVAQGTLAGGVGLLLWLRGATGPGAVAIAFGALFALLALLSPRRAYARVAGWISAAAWAVGQALTRAAMAAFFLLFLLPYGAAFRRGHRDRLRRSWDPDATSYWEPRERPTAASASMEQPF